MARKRTRRSKPRGAEKPSAPKTIPLARRHAQILLGLSVAGFLASCYLTYVHYRLHVDPGWRSACDIDPQLTCDAVVLSPYSVILRMPVSMIGMWFYLAAGLLVLATLRGRAWGFPRSPALVLFIAGLVATAVSIALGTVSIAVVGAVCPACVLSYGINVGLAVTAWHAIRRSGERVVDALRLERTYWKRRRGLVLLGVFAMLAVPGMGFVVYSHSAGGSVICEAVADAEISGRRSVELIVYSDFQCRHCRDAARDLRSLPRDGGLRFVFKHYPLDMSCNRDAKISRYPGSCRLAIAAICAEAQGHMADFSDALFGDKASAADTDLISLAGELGLDRDTFQRCLASDRAAQQLQDTIAHAGEEDVRATPTLFLNGRRHVGRLDANDLRCLAKAAERQP